MKLRLLLLEDDPAIAQTVVYAFEREGFAVQAVSLLSEARAALAEALGANSAGHGAGGRPGEEGEGLPGGGGGGGALSVANHAAHRAANHAAIDAAIFDVGLPDGSGLDLCRELRQGGTAHARLPIVMLSARTEEIDRVLGLELGADDYVSKPFSPRELVARVRALLRRASAPLDAPVGAQFGAEPGAAMRGDPAAVSPVLPTALPDRPGHAPVPSPAAQPASHFATASSHPAGPASPGLAAPPRLVCDARTHRALWQGQPLPLTRREWQLLQVLVQQPDRIWSRDALLDAAWGEAAEFTDRTVDTHIKTLRAKLREAGAEPELITTHRGLGYALQRQWL